VAGKLRQLKWINSSHLGFLQRKKSQKKKQNTPVSVLACLVEPSSLLTMRAFALASTLLLALVALHVLSQASAKTCFELGLGGERVRFSRELTERMKIVAM
jgi:hypothetical protein